MNEAILEITAQFKALLSATLATPTAARCAPRSSRTRRAPFQICNASSAGDQLEDHRSLSVYDFQAIFTASFVVPIVYAGNQALVYAGKWLEYTSTLLCTP